MLFFSCLLTAASLGGGAPAGPLAGSVLQDSATEDLAAQDFAIRAHQVLTAEALIEDGVVVVRGGDIAAVGKASEVETEGLRIVQHDGVVSAGLIACRAFPSVLRDAFDSTRTMLPEMRISDGVDPRHEDFELLRDAGITAVVVAPTGQNFVGGQTCVFKTDGTELRESAALAISLAQDTTNSQRGPTSMPGAVAEMRAALEAREGVWAEVADLRLPLFIDVDDRAALARAVALCKEYKLGGALYRAHLAGEVRDLLRTSRLGVVTEPLLPGHSERELLAIVQLAEIEIPIAFGLDMPLQHPDVLRLSAAMCVQAGMSPEAAWRALTLDASRIARINARTGQIAVGLDADLALWSGHPLDLASSIEAVYIDGRLVSSGGEED